MKKIILILCILLLGGCYDYVEVTDIAILTGMIIDYEDNKYKITSQLIVNEEENNIKVYTTKGESIEKALLEITKMLNKEVYISHLKTIFLTDRVIESKANYYDYLLRNAKSKMNFFVYYINGEDKLFDYNSSKNGSALYIENVTKYNDKMFSSSNSLSFIELVYEKLEYGLNIVYPSIETKEEQLLLSDLVSYNYKLKKLTLNQLESIYYNLTKNNTINSELEYKCDDNIFSLDVLNSKTTYKWEKEKFTITSNIDSILKNYNCKYNNIDKELNDKLSKIAEKENKKQIEKLISKAIDNENDFLGIGNYIYKHDKDYFDFKKNEWDPNLKNIKIKVHTNVNIKATGETRKGEKLWKK